MNASTKNKELETSNSEVVMSMTKANSKIHKLGLL